MRSLPIVLVLHLVAVAPVIAGGIPKFKQSVVDGNAFEPYCVRVGEINGDGRPDLVVVGEKEVVWYENPGKAALWGDNPVWKKHLITKETNRNVCGALVDLRGDKKLALAIAADWHFGDTKTPSSLWYAERDPSGDLDKPWKLRKLPCDEPTIHRIYWCDTRGDGEKELLVAPLQGRGSTKEKNWMDSPIKLMLFHPPKALMQDEWKSETVNESLHMCHNVWPFDWINDKHRDVILTASAEGMSNFSLGEDKKWVEGKMNSGLQVGTGAHGAGEIKSCKVKGWVFIFVSIEPFHGNQLADLFYAPDVHDPHHIIDDTLQEGHALVCADLDGDGNDEIIAGFRGGKGGLRIYSIVPKVWNWTRTILDEGTINVEDAVSADLDGDGKPDLVAVGRASHNVKIYLNTGKP